MPLTMKLDHAKSSSFARRVQVLLRACGLMSGLDEIGVAPLGSLAGIGRRLRLVRPAPSAKVSGGAIHLSFIRPPRTSR
jgi:hypothetical protein